MLPRRHFIGLIPVGALSLPATAAALQTSPAASKSSSGPLIISPPVVQHPVPAGEDRPAGVTINFAVSALATGWVQWGLTPDKLDRVAIAHQHGLVCASDRALSVRVAFDESVRPGQPIHYRVVAQPLTYHNAYQLHRGEPQSSEVHTLRLPDAEAAEATIAIVNDTHEQPETLRALHARLEALDPDVLVWNGDTCNDFDAQDDPLQIVLNPAGDPRRGWAATRPLLFVPGNHDVRGARARELAAGLSHWPGQGELPYNFALRVGPVALVGLDTGEDKPDAHPVFAGTAAYEPYRQAQATWLKSAVKRPEIAAAPLRVALCHIPLRGQSGQNDGTTLEGYAAYSGMGARLWLPTLRQAGFQAVISGHMHRHRVDDPAESEPLTQVVGGGPQPGRATLTLIRAQAGQMHLRVEDLQGQPLHQRHWSV